MNLYDSTFRFKDILQFIVPLAVLLYAYMNWKRKEALQRFSAPVTAFIEKNANRIFVASSLCYFAIAFLCKLSQQQTMLLSALDHWLFEDMLYWLGQGKPYITRFSALGDGPVQHGGVHAFLTFLLLYPFVKLFGSSLLTLIYNPAAIALGGYVLARLSTRLTGAATTGVLIAFAFWISEFTSRIVMHDMHPEAAYPALVVLTFYCSYENPRLTRTSSIFIFMLVWALLGGMKQDAILIGGTLWLWLTVNRKWSLRRMATAGTILLATFLIMTFAIGSMKSGQIGATTVTIGTYTSLPVALAPRGSHIVGGLQISDLESLLKFGQFLFGKQGSPLNFLIELIKYVFSDPVLYLWLTTPWLLLRREMWILVLPIVFADFVIGSDLKTLTAYHSAPLLGGYWIAVILSLSGRSEALLPNQLQQKAFKCGWVLTLSALIGGASLIYYSPSEETKHTLQEAQEVTNDLPAFGIVSSRLLSQVPHEKIWMSYIPTNGKHEPVEPSPYVKWVLLTKNHPSYEIPADVQNKWREYAVSSGRWKLITHDYTELYLRIEPEP